MVSREHLAVIRIGGGVARVGGVRVGSTAIVELWSRLWTGHGHWSRGGTSNRCRSGQGDSEQGGEDNNKLHKKRNVTHPITEFSILVSLNLQA